MSIIGTLHFFHAPLLVIYPLVLPPQYDLLYIKYFFAIMISYTFYNGECPISYIYKRRMNPQYIAGDRINDYDDLYAVCNDRIFVNNYLVVTTSLYSSSLIYTMYRANIDFKFTLFSMLVVLLYTSGIKEVYVRRNHRSFVWTEPLMTIYFVFAFFSV